MTRFQPWWTDNSPSYRDCIGYRIRDTLENKDVGFISCVAGKDRYARKDQAIAAKVAQAKCDKLNAETR
jgi:hypothetical protein